MESDDYLLRFNGLLIIEIKFAEVRKGFNKQFFLINKFLFCLIKNKRKNLRKKNLHMK